MAQRLSPRSWPRASPLEIRPFFRMCRGLSNQARVNPFLYRLLELYWSDSVIIGLDVFEEKEILGLTGGCLIISLF